MSLRIVLGIGEPGRTRKLGSQDSTMIVDIKILSSLIYLLEYRSTLWVALCLMSFIRRHYSGSEINYAHD